MSSAFSYDARDGISAAALDELRQANRFALGFVDNHTAVMGYWITAPESADMMGEEFRTLVLHGRADSGLPPQRLFPRHWRVLWRNVSRGDLLRAIVVGDAPTLAIAPPRDWLRSQPFEVFRPYRYEPPSSPSGEIGMA